MLNAYLPVLLLVSVLDGQSGTPAQVVRKTEYLLVAGNGDDGRGKLWAKSRGVTTSMVIPLGDEAQVSPACGPHPSRCRRLMVNSTYCDDGYKSNHTVFVPLQNGLCILELRYNGLAQFPSNLLSINHDQTMTLRYGMNCRQDCTSLGVYKVGVQFYSLCAAPQSQTICTCELDRNLLTLGRCHTFSVNIGQTFEQISDIVSSPNHRVLWFFVHNALFQLNPIDGSLQHLNIIHDCSSVTHLNLDDAGNILYVYCTNNVSIIYNLGDDRIIMKYEGQHFYPCSVNTNVTVTLSSPDRRADITYRTGDTETHSFLPGSAEFVTGICIVHHDDHVFVYRDRNDGTYLYNATENEISELGRGNQGCDQCEQPEVFGDRYSIIINHNLRAVAVYDLQNITLPTTTLYQASPQLVSLISDLPILHPEMPTLPDVITTAPSGASTVNLAAILAPVIIISLAIVAVLAVSFTFLLWWNKCSAKRLNDQQRGEVLVNRDTSREPSQSSHTTDNASQTNAPVDNSEDLVEARQEVTTRPHGPDNSTQQVLPPSSNSFVQCHVSHPRSSDSNYYPPPEDEVRSDNGPDHLSLAVRAGN